MARADRRILVSLNLRYILHSTLTGDSPLTLPVKRDAFEKDRCTCIGMCAGLSQSLRVMVTKIRSYPDDTAPLVVDLLQLQTPVPARHAVKDQGRTHVTCLLSRVSKSTPTSPYSCTGRTRL
jgi:hypothetical protein